VATTGQQHSQPPTAVDRMFQVQLVELAHELEVLLRLRARLVVVGRPTDVQQFALVTDAWLGQGFDPRSSLSGRPNSFHFFLSQSKSTVSWPIFWCNWAIIFSLSSAAGRPRSKSSGNRSRSVVFHWLTKSGCTWFSRAICAVV